MGGLDWHIVLDLLKWAVICLIMAAPMIQTAVNSRNLKRSNLAGTAPRLAPPRQLSMSDKALIERTRQILAELEQFIRQVVQGNGLLTQTLIRRIQAAELSARIASKELALVDCELTNEPAGVSYCLDRLLMQPFSPTPHQTAEEAGLVAMRQAACAHDLWEAVQKLRRTLGPAD